MMSNHNYSRSSFWKSFAIFAFLLFFAIAFLYFYDKNKSKTTVSKVEIKKTGATKAEFPKGQMEDGPALDDLPLLENVSRTIYTISN